MKLNQIDLTPENIQQVMEFIAQLPELVPVVDAALEAATTLLARPAPSLERLHDWIVARNIKEFNAYRAAGMTSDNAVALMAARGGFAFDHTKARTADK